MPCGRMTGVVGEAVSAVVERKSVGLVVDLQIKVQTEIHVITKAY